MAELLSSTQPGASEGDTYQGMVICAVGPGDVYAWRPAVLMPATRASDADIAAGTSTRYVDAEHLSTALNSLNITGDFIGTATTFAALPTVSSGGKTAVNGDWTYLTEEDGANLMGFYVTDGTTYSFVAPLGSAMPVSLKAFTGYSMTVAGFTPGTDNNDYAILTVADGANLPGVYIWTGAAYEYGFPLVGLINTGGDLAVSATVLPYASYTVSGAAVTATLPVLDGVAADVGSMVFFSVHTGAGLTIEANAADAITGDTTGAAGEIIFATATGANTWIAHKLGGAGTSATLPELMTGTEAADRVISPLLLNQNRLSHENFTPLADGGEAEIGTGRLVSPGSTVNAPANRPDGTAAQEGDYFQVALDGDGAATITGVAETETFTGLQASSHAWVFIGGQWLDLDPQIDEALTTAEITSTTGVDYAEFGTVSAERLDEWGQSRRIQRIFDVTAAFDYTALNYVDRTAVYVRNANNASGIGYTYRTDNTVSLELRRADGVMETDTADVHQFNVQPGEIVFGEKDGNVFRASIIPAERVKNVTSAVTANALGALPHDAVVTTRDGLIGWRKTGINNVTFPADGQSNADWFVFDLSSGVQTVDVVYHAAATDPWEWGKLNVYPNGTDLGAVTAPAIEANAEASLGVLDGSGTGYVLERHYVGNAAGDAILSRSGDQVTSTFTGRQLVTKINYGVATPFNLTGAFQVFDLGEDLSGGYIEVDYRNDNDSHVTTGGVHVDSIILGADQGALLHWYDTIYVQLRIDDTAALTSGQIKMREINARLEVVEIRLYKDAENGFVIPTGYALATPRTISLTGGLGTIGGLASATALESVAASLQLDLNAGQQIASATIDSGSIAIADPVTGRVIVTAGNADATITITEQTAATYTGLQRVGSRYYPGGRTGADAGVEITGNLITTSLDLTRSSGTLRLSFTDTGEAARPWPIAEIDIKEAKENGTFFVWNYDNSYITGTIEAEATGAIRFGDPNRESRLIWAEIVDEAANGFVVPTGTQVATPRTLSVTSPTATTDRTIVEEMGTYQRINVTADKELVLGAVADATISLIDPLEGWVIAQATGPNPSVTFTEVDRSLIAGQQVHKALLEGVANGVSRTTSFTPTVTGVYTVYGSTSYFTVSNYGMSAGTTSGSGDLFDGSGDRMNNVGDKSYDLTLTAGQEVFITWWGGGGSVSRNITVEVVKA